MLTSPLALKLTDVVDKPSQITLEFKYTTENLREESSLYSYPANLSRIKRLRLEQGMSITEVQNKIHFYLCYISNHEQYLIPELHYQSVKDALQNISQLAKGLTDWNENSYVYITIEKHQLNNTLEQQITEELYREKEEKKEKEEEEEAKRVERIEQAQARERVELEKEEKEELNRLDELRKLDEEEEQEMQMQKEYDRKEYEEYEEYEEEQEQEEDEEETSFSPQTSFSSGAVRDIIPEDVRYDLIPAICLERLAKRYHMGAVKYGDDNWKKGMPLRDTLNHAERHLQKYKMRELEGFCDLLTEEDKTDDHLAAATWGLFTLMYYEAVRNKKVATNDDDILTLNKLEETKNYLTGKREKREEQGEQKEKEHTKEQTKEKQEFYTLCPPFTPHITNITANNNIDFLHPSKVNLTINLAIKPKVSRTHYQEVMFLGNQIKESSLGAVIFRTGDTISQLMQALTQLQKYVKVETTSFDTQLNLLADYNMLSASKCKQILETNITKQDYTQQKYNQILSQAANQQIATEVTLSFMLILKDGVTVNK